MGIHCLLLIFHKGSGDLAKCSQPAMVVARTYPKQSRSKVLPFVFHPHMAVSARYQT